MHAGVEVRILQELQATLSQVSSEEVDRLVSLLGGANRIFVAGAGRSGLMCRAFAMRLMHLGMNACVVGEITTPSLSRDDLLLVFSGSGETAGLVSMAKKAVSIGAKLALCSIFPDSSIGAMSDVVVRIPAPTPKVSSADVIASIQPMGSLFEQSLLILSDAIVLTLMMENHQTSESMYGRHANLE